MVVVAGSGVGKTELAMRAAWLHPEAGRGPDREQVQLARVLAWPAGQDMAGANWAADATWADLRGLPSGAWPAVHLSSDGGFGPEWAETMLILRRKIGLDSAYEAPSASLPHQDRLVLLVDSCSGTAAGVSDPSLGTVAGPVYVVCYGPQPLGSHTEYRETEREPEPAVAADWVGVLQDVALRNARIGTLRASPEGSGPLGSASQAKLPPLLMLSTQTLAELRRWCADTDGLLASAESDVAEHTAQAIVRRAASLAGMAGFGAPDGQPGIAVTAASSAARASETMRADIARVARSLRPGVTAAELEDVAQAAARVLAARSQINARNCLTDMRVRVHRANEAATSRHEQATEAARLLQSLPPADISIQPLRADLLGVVSSDAPLTDVLRERARQAAADRNYAWTTFTEAATEPGYMIGGRSETEATKDEILQD